MILSKVEIPKPQKNNFMGFVYIVKFYCAGIWVYKIGYTNHIIRRILQESKVYNATECNIIWVSPMWRESTARRIEFKLHQWIERQEFERIPKERFLLPKGQKFQLIFKVRKTYVVEE